MFDVDELESHDIIVICTCFSLLYMYFWLDLKSQLFGDIDLAYSIIHDDTDEEPITAQVNIPYNSISIISPTIGCILKALLMAFVLFVAINLSIIVLSTCTTINYSKTYLKYDIHEAISKLENGDHENITPQQGGAIFKRTTQENTASKEEKEALKQQQQELKQQQKQEKRRKDEEEKRRKREERLKKRYLVSKDIPIIFESIDTEYDKQEAIINKAKSYWLFFILNFQMSIALVIISIIISMLFCKLIIPHITDIQKDPVQMKHQIEILMYVNCAIYIGGLWYMALKTIE